MTILSHLCSIILTLEPCHWGPNSVPNSVSHPNKLMINYSMIINNKMWHGFPTCLLRWCLSVHKCRSSFVTNTYKHQIQIIIWWHLYAYPVPLKYVTEKSLWSKPECHRTIVQNLFKEEVTWSQNHKWAVPTFTSMLYSSAWYPVCNIFWPLCLYIQWWFLYHRKLPLILHHMKVFKPLYLQHHT